MDHHGGPSKLKVDIDALQEKIDQDDQKLSKKNNQIDLNQK
jgi:hypothetical protein